ncbi:colicin uptake protein TolR [Ferrovum sp. JA12]|uniref:ExbD/TolR family protein n=1 Tax=Ferrovum sp. JA12 TaxID=1356299 RepID=UPI000703526F|nr:biopolymer transporter ExbD [Ferrovum sp. JA12]KRH78893.1 colicin uptake protein TolR [Ferrovum sp. JA12]HQT81612.1 biopolymer transporter ExbD [Ferrovaceae bacterium]HQU06501.1 biopolymer transporter ExbD [Ferrovaceae bacterium]
MDFRRGQRREDPEINLIPMIDILLVIVIFLMVSSTFVHQQGLNIVLPQGSAKSMVMNNDETIEVDMDISGIVKINQHLWSRQPTELKQWLSKQIKQPMNVYIVIRADKNLSHGSVMQVISDFQNLGFSHFTLVTEEKNH